MDIIRLEKKNDQILRSKVWQFKPMFMFLNFFLLFIILAITLIIFYPPSSPTQILSRQTLNLGFYWVDAINDKFSSVYINCLSIIITIFSIIYIFLCCLFYWVYWNKKWTKYAGNASIIFYIVISIILVIGGLIIGYVNSPYINFSNLTPSLGLDNSTNVEGVINYNFIYNCNFHKNQSGIISSYNFSITKYGILDIVIESCLIFLLLINKIIMIKRGK